ncbi:DUF4157 domain-containing protein [Cyanobacteria bacterium FACHB-471]|nr:DUF4157 domain-containing protein [Cyanobacteria bacterium FACHB-471]
MGERANTSKKSTWSPSPASTSDLFSHRPFGDPLYDNTPAQDEETSELQAKQDHPKPIKPDWNRVKLDVDRPPAIQPRWQVRQPSHIVPTPTGTLQRQESEPLQEDADAELVQTKLKVGAPGDRYEQEADYVAAQVMAMPDSEAQPIQRQTEDSPEEEGEEIQMKPLAQTITPLVQRQSEEETEDVQAKADGSAIAQPDLESRLASSRGGGSPLSDEVRSHMEPRFGTDFSHVRVHTDSSAIQMNKDLRAQAFTHGSNIYFGAGKSPGKNELTAHELTHVVQQTGAKTLQRRSTIALKSSKDVLQTKISAAPEGATIQGKQAPRSPQADPGFQAVVKRTETVAKEQKKHPPAKAKATEAQAAAVPPSNEKQSKAQDRQVQEMNQQQPGQFNTAAFKAALMEKINAATPKNLDEADKFKDGNKLGAVKSDLSSQVGNEKKQAAGPIEEKTKEAPKTGGIPEKPVTPLPPPTPAKPPGDIGASQATPKPKDASEVSMQEGSRSLDRQMTDAKVTDEQLEKSNEPEFKAALGSKKEAQANAATAPAEYRQQEQATLAQAQTQAQASAQAPLQGMQAQNAQVLAQVTGQQGTTKGHDEQKRSEIAGRIEGIYNNTKQKVESLLSSLDGEVNQEFDRGTSAAKSQFDTYVDQEMKRYKDKRYGGPDGALLWVRDLFLPLPDEVNKFYQIGRRKYIDSMTATIDRVASLVVTKLNAAKTEITNGKQEIQKYVASLDPSLRQLGQEAAQNIQSKFDQLEQNVDNKQNELIDSLAQKYNENLQALDADIEKRKAENQGWVNKAKEAMGGVIQTILELKNMLMGMLAKASGAVEKIIKDPIGFLGNLVAGIKQGFMGFMGNITNHLKKGLIGWLTGQIASTGIEIPKSFDLKGIFAMVTSLLGLTYQAMRNRVAGKVGEKKVSALEKGFDMFILWKNEGAAGLWKFIQDKLANLKEMVIGGIQSFVVDTIINAGVTWVLSLLNPASAFVRACKLIIDVIMFFVERGSQIAELVNAVLDSVGAIADGAIGIAAKLVEGALSKALPVVISFLASLIGLSGISGKIRGLIEKARGLVDKAIDWVMSKAIAFAKKLGSSKLGKKFKAGAAKAKDLKDRGVNKVKDLKERGKAKVQDLKEHGKKKLQDVGKRFGGHTNKGESKPGSDKRTIIEKEADLKKALRDSDKIMEKVDATPDSVRAKLPDIQKRYKLTSIELLKADKNKYHVTVKINPGLSGPPHPLSVPGLYPTGEDPNSRTITQLWKDCSSNTNLIGESAAQKPRRIQLAEQTLISKLSNSAMVTAILSHDRGQSPRPFNSVSVEDGLGLGGHTTERHVFGMGIVSDVEKLAMRVCRHQPASCPGKAGAFTSLGDADISVRQALIAQINSNWDAVRMQIITGQTLQLLHRLSSRGTALVKTDPPPNTKYLATAMPSYAHPMGTGNRPLYPGDPKMPVPPNSANPMTQYVTPTEVYIRFVPNSAAPGGWYINSAWPQ